MLPRRRAGRPDTSSVRPPRGGESSALADSLQPPRICDLRFSLRREHAAVRHAVEVAQHAYLRAVMAYLVQGRRDDRRAIRGWTRLIAVGILACGSLERVVGGCVERALENPPPSP